MPFQNHHTPSKGRWRQLRQIPFPVYHPQQRRPGQGGSETAVSLLAGSPRPKHQRKTGRQCAGRPAGQRNECNSADCRHELGWVTHTVTHAASPSHWSPAAGGGVT